MRTRTLIALAVLASLMGSFAARPSAAEAAAPTLTPFSLRFAFLGSELAKQAWALSQVAVNQLERDATSQALAIVNTAENIVDNAHVKPYWFETVHSYQDVQHLANKYGVDDTWFEALNPGVDLQQIDEDTRILFYVYDPENPASSWGKANAGRLVNGMPMPESDLWVVRNHRETWGTPETIRYLTRGYEYIERQFPGRGPTVIGDISLPRGGRLNPHKSHRTGRDVDAAYYGNENVPAGTFWDAISPNIDLERNWALFKFWVDLGVVEYIFVDTRVQRALVDYALQHGESEEYLRSVFQALGNARAPIRHARGHFNHYHVRFRCEDTDPNCR